MTGIEIARAMQTSEKIPHVPMVILVSAYTNSKILKEAREVEVIKDVLGKPVLPSTLFEAIMVAKQGKVRKESRQILRQDELLQKTSRLKAAKILIVEDNAINQDVAADLFANHGIDFRIAENGQIALEMLELEHFDGVLMDCQMPVMDGYTATKKIRENSRFKDLPIIAMTANVMSGDREKSIEAGMNDHIGKPIRVQELFLVMDKWIKPEAPPGQTVQQRVEEEFENIIGIDITEGLANIQGNVELYRKLLQKFSDDYHNFDSLFMAALEDNDENAPTRCAHTLKSVVATIGAHGVRDKAKALEAACQEHQSRQQLNRMAKEITAELSQIIDNLAGLSEPSYTITAPDTSDVSHTQVEMINHITKLRQLIDESDIKAIAMLEELIKMPGIEKYLNRMNEALRALQNYDFDKAQEHLCKIELPENT